MGFLLSGRRIAQLRKGSTAPKSNDNHVMTFGGIFENKQLCLGYGLGSAIAFPETSRSNQSHRTHGGLKGQTSSLIMRLRQITRGSKLLPQRVVVGSELWSTPQTPAMAVCRRPAWQHPKGQQWWRAKGRHGDVQKAGMVAWRAVCNPWAPADASLA